MPNATEMVLKLHHTIELNQKLTNKYKIDVWENLLGQHFILESDIPKDDLSKLVGCTMSLLNSVPYIYLSDYEFRIYSHLKEI